MGRGGKRKTQEVPERRCIATGEVGPTAGMIRFVVGPDNAVVPDLAGKLPGRGIWVTATREALELAIAKKLFSRSAKMQVAVPEGLVETIVTGLTRRVIDGLSLARKAGQAVAGYERVKGWLETEDAAVLIQASDGSTRGKTKLSPPEGDGTYIGWMTSQELGLAFGRGNVIHGALAAGGLAQRVVEDATKLKGVRELKGASAPMEGTKTT